MHISYRAILFPSSTQICTVHTDEASTALHRRTTSGTWREMIYDRWSKLSIASESNRCLMTWDWSWSKAVEGIEKRITSATEKKKGSGGNLGEQGWGWTRLATTITRKTCKTACEQEHLGKWSAQCQLHPKSKPARGWDQTFSLWWAGEAAPTHRLPSNSCLIRTKMQRNCPTMLKWLS